MNNPYALRGRKRPTKSITLKCTENEAEFPIEVRRLSAIEMADVPVQAQNYAYKYLGLLPDGRYDTDAEVTPLPAVDGEPLDFTIGTASILVTVEKAQIGEKKWSFVDLLAMTVSDDIATQLVGLSMWCYPQLSGLDDTTDPMASSGTDSSSTASAGSTDTQS